MSRKLLIICFIIHIILNYACLNTHKNEESILSTVENIIDIYPDSAYSLLQSLIPAKPHPNTDFYNKYYLLLIKAKYKIQEDISSDTIIFRVKDYYKSKKDNVNFAIASLYTGLVLLERKENKKAMISLLDAEKYMDGIPEQYDVKGLIQTNIGELFYEELLVNEAIKRFKKAAFYFCKNNSYINEAILYNYIGVCFLMKTSQNDSASYYLQKGLYIAEQLKDNNLKSNLLQNTGILYLDNGDIDKALDYFTKALTFSNDNIQKAKIAYNIADAYISANKTDSAKYFIDHGLNLIQFETDYSIKKYLNEANSKILKSQGKYKEALELKEDFLEFVEQEYLMNEHKYIFETEKKYNYELIKSKHRELLIKNQKWIIIFLILMLTSIISGIIYYIRLSRNKKALIKAEYKIMAFNNMVEDYKQKDKGLKKSEEHFKTILLEYFNIFKKAALLEGYIRQDEKENGEKVLKKFNEIIYGKEKLDWKLLYDTMNKLHNGFLDSLHKTYPELDEEEFKICCLIYSNFSTKEISIIIGLTNRTITARRSSIRKKIGIDEYCNINEYLKNTVK